jgi:signal peptidase I
MSVQSNKKILWWSIAGVLATLLVIRSFFIDYNTIPQNGMFPTLPAGSRFFTVKHPYKKTQDVKRGDIIMFTMKAQGNSYPFIWRVIGLPGDTIVTAGSDLTINGQAVHREKIREANGIAVFREQTGDASYEIAVDASSTPVPPDVTVTVPPDHFFVMGDNRNAALDSRSLGTVPFTSIFAKKL